MQCEQCFLIFEPKDMINDFGLPGMDDSNRCPGCRAQMKRRQIEGPQEVDGKLTLVTEDHAAAIRKARHKEVLKAKTFEELQAIGRERKYDENWAKIQWSFKLKARERAKERWGYGS